MMIAFRDFPLPLTIFVSAIIGMLVGREMFISDCIINPAKPNQWIIPIDYKRLKIPDQPGKVLMVKKMHSGQICRLNLPPMEVTQGNNNLYLLVDNPVYGVHDRMFALLIHKDKTYQLQPTTDALQYKLCREQQRVKYQLQP